MAEVETDVELWRTSPSFMTEFFKEILSSSGEELGVVCCQLRALTICRGEKVGRGEGEVIFLDQWYLSSPVWWSRLARVTVTVEAEAMVEVKVTVMILSERLDEKERGLKKAKEDGLSLCLFGFE